MADLSNHAELQRAAELARAAALAGETIRRAAVSRARDALDVKGPTGAGAWSGKAWRSMAPELRQVLASLATDRRDPEAVALLPWHQLADDERIAIGAMAREWRRQLELAAWLR